MAINKLVKFTAGGGRGGAFPPQRLQALLVSPIPGPHRPSRPERGSRYISGHRYAWFGQQIPPGVARKGQSTLAHTGSACASEYGPSRDCSGKLILSHEPFLIHFDLCMGSEAQWAWIVEPEIAAPNLMRSESNLRFSPGAAWNN